MTTAKLLELIAELEGSVVIECRAAVFRMELHDERVAKRREVHAAIRALSGENVELRDDRAIRHIERTALRAEVERLKQDLAHDRHQWNLAVSDAEEARAEVAALKIDNQTLRDLLAVAEERDEL